MKINVEECKNPKFYWRGMPLNPPRGGELTPSLHAQNYLPMPLSHMA